MFKTRSIKFKILALILGVGILPALLLVFVAPYRIRQLGGKILQMEAKFITKLLSENLALGMQTMILDDGESLQKTLNSLQNGENDEYSAITSVKVFDSGLEFVKGLNAEAQKTPFQMLNELQFKETADELIAFTPMRSSQETIEGYIEINFSKKFLNDQVASNSNMFILLSLLALTTSLGIGFWVVMRIANSLVSLSDSAEEIAQGNVDVDVSLTSNDEIGSLAESFRKIVQSQKAKAETAEQIAMGNLEVEVKAVSGKDVLGKSMVSMKESLNAMLNDLRTTIEGQKSGDIAIRCHPEKLKGAFANLLQ